MTEELNPTFAQGETELYHAGETPPAGHAFYPTAYCGAVMTGTRFDKRSDLPHGYELCATDAKKLGITEPEAQAKAADKPAPAPKPEATT